MLAWNLLSNICVSLIEYLKEIVTIQLENHNLT
jgi:hypothetical protein